MCVVVSIDYVCLHTVTIITHYLTIISHYILTLSHTVTIMFINQFFGLNILIATIAMTAETATAPAPIPSDQAKILFFLARSFAPGGRMKLVGWRAWERRWANRSKREFERRFIAKGGSNPWSLQN